ncbi:sensor histidine kinase [Microlunatus sp. Y2014]|uniref:sensor histidine kinase n=1 Tax=Microlunatus sp. Y2014 TaxID=3418488 RepID=UPI003DA6FDC8
MATVGQSGNGTVMRFGDHARVLVRHARMKLGQGWRSALRLGMHGAVAAAAVSLVLVGVPTVAGISSSVRWVTDVPVSVEGSDFHGAIVNVQRSLESTGGLEPVGNSTWRVDWVEVDAGTVTRHRDREFVDEAAAREFAAQVDGAVVRSMDIPLRDWVGRVVTAPDGRPAMEIVTADGRLIHRSPAIPVAPGHQGPITPDVPHVPARETPSADWVGQPIAGSGGPQQAVCVLTDSTYWRYGEGVLRDVPPPAEGAAVRICVFRTADHIRAAQLREVGAVLSRGVETFPGYWAITFPVLLAGAVVVDRFRHRLRRAAQQDVPALMAKPRPGSLLGGLTDDVNQSLSRARASVEQQRGFVADAAHELRSPLSSLITTLEVAERHPHLVDSRQVTRTSLTQARRLERLTQDLLLLARLDARAPLREDVVDLADVVREVVSDSFDPGRPITLDGLTPTPAIGDRDAFRRILQNLIDNAVRHAATGVTVSVTHERYRARLIVANDGTPVPAADADRIFDRFTRLDESRGRNAGGSGLGLAIARGLAERYRGTLELLPGRTDGAAFSWEVPLAR